MEKSNEDKKKILSINYLCVLEEKQQYYLSKEDTDIEAIDNLIKLLSIDIEDNFLLFQKIISILIENTEFIFGIFHKINQSTHTQNHQLITKINLLKFLIKDFILNKKTKLSYESDLLYIIFSSVFEEDNLDIRNIFNYINNEIQIKKKLNCICFKELNQSYLNNHLKEKCISKKLDIYRSRKNKFNNKIINKYETTKFSLFCEESLLDENNNFYETSMKNFIENIFLKNNYKSKANDLMNINLSEDSKIIIEFEFKQYIKELYVDEDQNYYINNIFNHLINKQNYINLNLSMKFNYLLYISSIFPLLSNNQRSNLIQIIELNLITNADKNTFKSKEENKLFNKNTFNILKKIIFPFNDKLENLLKTYFKLSGRKENSKIKNFISNQNIFIKDIFNFIYLIIFDEIFMLLRPSTKLKIKFLIWIFYNTFNKKTLALKKILYYINVFKRFYNNQNFNRIYSNYFQESIYLNSNLNTQEYKTKNCILFDNFTFEDFNFDEIPNSYLNNVTLDNLFDEQEKKIFEETIKGINYHYEKYSRIEIVKIIINSINKNNLKENNFNNRIDNKNNYKYARKYIFRILKLMTFKNSENYFNSYRNSLLKLEKEIYGNYLNFNQLKNNIKENIKLHKKDKKIYEDDLNYLSRNLYDKQYEVYEYLKDLVTEIKYKIFNEKNIIVNVQLIPFGSVTQFLGNPTSDLDLLLTLKLNEDRVKYGENFSDYFNVKIISKYLCLLFKRLEAITNKKLNKIINHRLFTFTFEMMNIKVDINFNNYFGVLNSLLLRTYSLIDNRFLIICHYLKKLLERLGLKNTETNKNYINSYSWALILITYLQNLKKPILPKLLEYDRSREKSGYYELKIINKRIFTNLKDNINEISNFNFIDDSNILYNNKKSTSAQCVGSLIYKNKVKEFYDKKKMFNKNTLKNQIKHYLNSLVSTQFYELSTHFSNLDKNRCVLKFIKNCDNDMTLSEILIKFIEFFIFYFEFEFNFISVSYHNEGFCSKKIFNGKKNEYTFNFNEFKNEFVVSKYFLENYSLIRDPFDHSYNPIKVSREKFNEIKKKFKDFYFSIFKDVKNI